MTKVDKLKPQSSQSDAIKVVFHPHCEDVEIFERRTAEVQQLLIKMILLAGKKGRPSMVEDDYEKAA